MNRLLQGYANMPAATKIVIAVLALAFTGVIVYIFGSALAIYVVLAGLIVIGLILGVGYAARPELTEALASTNLLGASSGHGMAVRRPG